MGRYTPSLGANSDGNYHLGGGGVLTLTQGVLVGAGACLQVGSLAQNGSGKVILSAAQYLYGGGTTVNPGSTLEGAAQPAARPSALPRRG